MAFSVTGDERDYDAENIEVKLEEEPLNQKESKISETTNDQNKKKLTISKHLYMA